MSRPDRLYALLPALHRKLDLQEGMPLRALLAVLQAELDLLEEDIEAQYDNWFIETSDRWAIPYIADLIGVPGLNDPQQLFAGQRRRVANALRYRRRKGTLAVLEHVLHDVTDWPSHAVEYYRYLSMTQHVDHPQPKSGRTFDVSDLDLAAGLNTPFDANAHGGDIRSIAISDRPHQRRGRYNFANIGIFLWRLRPYTVQFSPAFRTDLATDQIEIYTFDPLGRDAPLFNSPLSEPDAMFTTAAVHVPLRISNALLAADLAAYDKQPPARRSEDSLFYGPNRGLAIDYHVHTDHEDDIEDDVEKNVEERAQRRAIRPDQVVILKLPEGLAGFAPPPGKLAAIDAERGRFALFEEARPQQKSVPIITYTYGFNADLGGGPYERRIPLQLDDADVLHIYVAKGCANDSFDDVYARHQNSGEWVAQAGAMPAALDLWDRFAAFKSVDRANTARERSSAQSGMMQPAAVIQILDNGVYAGQDSQGDLVIRLLRGAHLSIVAADGVRPILAPEGRVVLSHEWNEAVPAELGHFLTKMDIAETGVAESTAVEHRLTLHGLYINAPFTIDVHNSEALLRSRQTEDNTDAAKLQIDIEHCTLLPDGDAIQIKRPAPQDVELQIRNTISGAIRLKAAVALLRIEDSIVRSIEAESTWRDAGNGNEPPTGQTYLERVTVMEDARLQSLTLARDAIFAADVTVQQAKPGDEFSHCVLRAEVTAEIGPKPLLNRSEVGKKLTFSAIAYGDPAFGRLSLESDPAILCAAHDGGRPGAFAHLNETQRIANIKPILDDYLPFGLEAGIFYVT